MDVDLIVQNPVPVEVNNPKNVYKIKVVSEHGPISQSEHKSILLKSEKAVIARVKLLIFYFQYIKKVGYIPGDESVAIALERECYNQKLDFNVPRFWKAVIGYDSEYSEVFATPVSFVVTFFDHVGFERAVSMTVDGHAFKSEVHVKDIIPSY